MELKWLEDFLLLLETGSFSKAAARRHVTQPAFSRRIRALEHWLGVPLVDRSRAPLRFTEAARAGEDEVRHIVSRFYELRSHLRAEAVARRRVAFTAQHTLSVVALPRLLRFVEQAVPQVVYRARSANKPDCIAQLARGEADFLLCYDKPGLEPVPAGLGARRLRLGTERLVPVSGCAEPNRPLHGPQPDRPLPLLAYPEDSFLGQALRDDCLRPLMMGFSVQTVCVSAFTIALKEMALNGLGIAWLPHDLVADDLRAGRLHSLEPVLSGCPLQISLYATTTPADPDIERIWQALEGATVTP